MKKAPIPKNEEARLKAVQQLNVLDTQPEPRFDSITKRATELLHVPISTISIIDENREWFKSCQGLGAKEGSRAESFCGHAMLANKIFIVEDTLRDPLFADNPHVIGGEKIRFYAGVALYEQATKLPIGVFCVKDAQPRTLSLQEIGIILDLAKEAEKELNRT